MKEMDPAEFDEYCTRDSLQVAEWDEKMIKYFLGKQNQLCPALRNNMSRHALTEAIPSHLPFYATA